MTAACLIGDFVIGVGDPSALVGTGDWVASTVGLWGIRGVDIT